MLDRVITFRIVPGRTFSPIRFIILCLAEKLDMRSREWLQDQHLYALTRSFYCQHDYITLGILRSTVHRRLL